MYKNVLTSQDVSKKLKNAYFRGSGGGLIETPVKNNSGLSTIDVAVKYSLIEPRIFAIFLWALAARDEETLKELHPFFEKVNVSSGDGVATKYKLKPLKNLTQDQISLLGKLVSDEITKSDAKIGALYQTAINDTLGVLAGIVEKVLEHPVPQELDQLRKQIREIIRKVDELKSTGPKDEENNAKVLHKKEIDALKKKVDHLTAQVAELQKRYAELKPSPNTRHNMNKTAETKTLYDIVLKEPALAHVSQKLVAERAREILEISKKENRIMILTQIAQILEYEFPHNGSGNGISVHYVCDVLSTYVYPDHPELKKCVRMKAPLRQQET